MKFQSISGFEFEWTGMFKTTSSDILFLDEICCK